MTEHATLADGIVLRDLTAREYDALRWDAVEGHAYELIADDPVTGNGSEEQA